jgi:hypothetical protein
MLWAEAFSKGRQIRAVLRSSVARMVTGRPSCRLV